MYRQILEQLGLSTNESKVYLALIDEGQTSAGKLATATKLHRPNVYDALQRLTKRGLVSTSNVSNTKVFAATNPENLLHILEDTQREVERILPELIGKKQLSEPERFAVLLEGVSAFMDVLYDLLKYNADFNAYGIPKNAPEKMKHKIIHFHNKRIEKEIVMRHIYNHNAKDRIAYLKTLPLTEAKYLPQEYDAMVSTLVCGPEIVIIDWSDGLNIIRIKDEKLARSYERYFYVLYKHAK